MQAWDMACEGKDGIAILDASQLSSSNPDPLKSSQTGLGVRAPVAPHAFLSGFCSPEGEKKVRV